MWLDAETLFKIFNAGVLPFWLLLIVLPKARITARLVHSGVVPCIWGIGYIVMLAAAIATAGPDSPGLDFGSLAGIGAGFQNPLALLGGWIHYLVFDLFVGSWCSRDAARNGIPHLVIVPVLIVVLMAGPAGLLLYLGLRWFWKRRFTLNEAA